jgi:hypothetical protein
MATQTSNNTSAPQGDSATLGLGGATSGQTGATPTHETQQETGGSGGPQLTRSTGEIERAPGSRPQPTPDAPQAVPDPDGSAMQSGARGAQDTRADQAGGTGTGLGTPETGANQSEEDLPPAR